MIRRLPKELFSFLLIILRLIIVASMDFFEIK